MVSMIDILDERQLEIRHAERQALGQLLQAIEPLEPDPKDSGALRQAVEDLEELFLLVVVGEFNAGKSAFINALLGQKVLPEGVTPTTATINLLRHGDQPTERLVSDFVTERTFPAEFLREISIVDTPGTNAIIRRHEELTRTFVPRSDMVLFLTSADRPFTESERGFMETIREWGKKIVVVLNKIDLLQTTEDLDRVLHFIQENSLALLGQQPEIYPVSARLAQRAREMQPGIERDAIMNASRMEQLEKYIFSTLDEVGRIRLKLSTPLGIAGRVAERYHQVTRTRLAVLAEDFKTVENIEGQIGLYRGDMEREFAGRLSQIENIIYEMRERGDAFFEETLRVGRIRDLLNSEKIKREFEDRVVSDSARRIDDAVSGLINWMVDQDLRLWQAVMQYVSRRRDAGVASTRGFDEHVKGSIGGQFESNRESLLRSVVLEARRVVETYDRRQQADAIAQDMRTAVGQMMVAGGGVAVGVLVSLAFAAAFIDITGITAALLSGAAGLFVLPYRKRKAKQEFRERTEELRDKLVAAMSTQFNTELDQSTNRIREALAPYTRFVRLEQTRMTAADIELSRIQESLDSLRAQVETIGR